MRRTLVRLLSVLIAMTGLLVPATAAHASPHASPLICLWKVTAAGNGQIARRGVTHTAPAAFTMYTGNTYDVVKTNPIYNSDGLLWMVDNDSPGVYLPYQQISTGTYYLQYAGSCYNNE